MLNRGPVKIHHTEDQCCNHGYDLIRGELFGILLLEKDTVYTSWTTICIEINLDPVYVCLYLSLYLNLRLHLWFDVDVYIST